MLFDAVTEHSDLQHTYVRNRLYPLLKRLPFIV